MQADGHTYGEYQRPQFVALSTRTVLIIHKYCALSATCFGTSVPSSGSTACKV